MHFLPDVYVTCDVCKGKRYNRETLEVLFKGKSIADVLDMTVEEAAEFFKAVPRVRETFKTLHRVGLDYIHVGQQATTLSGGEAQRVKLAKELSKRATGRTLYILDEPTTGLHFHDVKKLLEVLHELVSQGNTVVVIEHNLEVIKTADSRVRIDLAARRRNRAALTIVGWGPRETSSGAGYREFAVLARSGAASVASERRFLITSRLCSMTTTVLPCDTSSCSTSNSFFTSWKCSPWSARPGYRACARWRASTVLLPA